MSKEPSPLEIRFHSPGNLPPYPLGDEPITIGRHDDCDITLESGLVSGRHCEIARHEGEYRLLDLESTNGTFVNGVGVTEHILQPGDILDMGEYRISVQAADAPPGDFSLVDDRDSTLIFRLNGDEQGKAIEKLLGDSSHGLEGNQSPRVSRLRILYEFVRRSSELETEDELFQEAATALVKLPTVHRCQFIAYDPKSNALRCVVSATERGVEPPGKRQISKMVINRVLKHGEAVISGNAQDDKEFDGSISIIELDIGSLLAVPLRHGGEINGVMTLASRSGEPPFTEDDLEYTVAFAGLLEREHQRHRTHERLVSENRALQETLRKSTSIVGQSPEIKELMENVAVVASVDSRALILGESGTGKELVARSLHDLSPRKDKPFVVVGCENLTRDHLASELFGHKKGAYTGAVDSRIGKFEEANGGTIFLDEIGDLDVDLQARLLRVLQEGDIERLGDNRRIHVDVRVVAATNRDMEQLVADGRFRQDLYYRLNVITLNIPPLRERQGDVRLLFEHFFARSCRSVGRIPQPKILDETWQYIEKYAWPGNVREVMNISERLAVLTTSKSVTPDKLPPGIRPQGELGMSDFGPYRSIAQVEREHIVLVLDVCGWNKKKAASILDISRDTLHNKIKKFQLEQPRS